MCDKSLSIVWGAAAIAKAINRTQAATFHMLERGQLPGASKVGGKWCFLPDVFLQTIVTPHATNN